jgi:B-cell receptor-associated protein 31
MAAEMATFVILVLPLPFTVRKKLFTFLSENPLIAKLAYGLKISFIFIAILFVDAVQRMVRITAQTETGEGSQGMHDVRTETNFAARKFYAQRNMYLTGFTLFLSIILTRTFYILLDLVHVQGEYAELKKAGTSANGKAGASSAEVAALKQQVTELQAKERDFDNLKKQAKQQAAEYDRLATEYNKATGSSSNKRVD